MCKVLYTNHVNRKTSSRQKEVITLAKRDRAEYFREYRKKKFLDNGKVEMFVYIDRDLRDRLNELLKTIGKTRSEWLEDMIRKDVRGLCMEE